MAFAYHKWFKFLTSTHREDAVKTEGVFSPASPLQRGDLKGSGMSEERDLCVYQPLKVFRGAFVDNSGDGKFSFGGVFA
ncbi:hypothetical protein AVEN_200403-1 [Araneus ventricosus]|uniref:Uncharacterized protein n=1 Tax=Araneus ventricosus TaxID=182803 RepID=A0A4Y2RV49_ARAVE|nr:hypothetical protein AVEN_200403-1 [Araneus ventricosus]